MSLQEELRAKQAATERWMREREAQVRRIAAQAEARGRQVYANAIKTGEKIVARTPSEIRELGKAALHAAIRPTVRPPAAAPVSPKPSARRALPQGLPAGPIISQAVKRQFAAGVSGLVDEATMGAAAHVLAGGDAILQAMRDGNAADLRRDYDAAMATKREEDAFDAENYGAARNVGRVVGFVGSVTALGAPAVTRALVSKLPRGAAVLRDIAVGAKRGPDPRGLTRLAAAGGAAAGVAGQVGADVITGNRSDARDTIGAALGGAAGGVATRFVGPTVGGAAGGVTTSVVTDLLHGRGPSLDNALADGRAAAALGRVGDIAGRHWVSALNSKAKGEVGELYSRAKSVMRGDRIAGTQTRVPLKSGGYTIADEVGPDLSYIGESKMGPGARLSKAQSEAKRLYGDRYILDHWRFSDVGRAAGGAVAPLGANVTDEDRMAAMTQRAR